MRMSFVLRLDPDALTAGRFSGEVEAVASGALAALRSVDDLVTFCTGHVDDTGGHTVVQLDPGAEVQGPLARCTGGEQEGRQR